MQSALKGSMATTNTLKGLTILIVLINHYLNWNITGDSSDYANAWVAIFFFLSGYGIFYSIERAGGLDIKSLWLFYFKRIVRIFPLLWIAWAIEFLLMKGNLTPWILTGVRATGHYWFIPAILHCYAIAPLAYWILEKRNPVHIVSLFTGFSLVNYLIFLTPQAHELSIWLDLYNFNWRHYFLIHIMIFGLGMLCSQALMERGFQKRKRSGSKPIFWVAVFGITSSMILLRYYIALSPASMGFAFQIVSLLAIVLLCDYCMRNPIKIRFLEFFGSISYSIYLFHKSYYILLNQVGSFPENSIGELVLHLVTFPAFLFACRYLERFGGYASKKLVGLVTVTHSPDPIARASSTNKQLDD